jgi:seryl-tRNA synthetase
MRKLEDMIENLQLKIASEMTAEEVVKLSNLATKYKKEHDALCKWVNELSELTHGYREASEEAIYKQVESLIEDHDKYKKVLEAIWESEEGGVMKKGGLSFYELQEMAKEALG